MRLALALIQELLKFFVGGGGGGGGGQVGVQFNLGFVFRRFFHTLLPFCYTISRVL